MRPEADAATQLPPHDFADLIRDNVMKVAPAGYAQVFFNGFQLAQVPMKLSLQPLSVITPWMAKGIAQCDMAQLEAIGFDNSTTVKKTSGCLSVSSLSADANQS